MINSQFYFLRKSQKCAVLHQDDLKVRPIYVDSGNATKMEGTLLKPATCVKTCAFVSFFFLKKTTNIVPADKSFQYQSTNGPWLY